MNTNYIYSLISNNNDDCNYKIIKDLINKGIDIHYDNDYALVESTYHYNPKTVKLLLDSGCNIHAYDDRAFISSVTNNHYEVAKLLLENGAYVDANDYEAIKFCSIVNNIKMIKLLLDYGANYLIILKYYISKCNFELINILCEAGIDFNKYNILLDVCYSSINDSHYDIIILLLNYGAKINNTKINPISLCIKHNNIRIIKLFIEKQVNINNECLKICSEVNHNDSHFDIVKIFYDQGVNFNYINFNSSNVNTINYINQNFMNIKFRDLDICPITFESLENEEKLGCINCLNVFKKEAINQWLSYNNICPLYDTLS